MTYGLRKELRETEDEAYELRDALHAARMTLRDTFAAAALTGLLAGGLKNPAMHGALVYEIADAILKAREAK